MTEHAAHVDHVRKLGEERIAALTRGDTRTLDRMMHEGLIYIHASARLDTKRSFLESVAANKTIYKTISISQVQLIEANDQTVIRTGNMDGEVRANGLERKFAATFTEVWTRDGQDWRVISWQATHR